MKLCLFSSYYEGNIIPNYVKFWLESLIKFNDEVILITNDRKISDNDISFLNQIGVKLLKVENEGFDFGMWYKALETISDDYDQISLINDSTLLFNDLEKVYNDANKYEYYGMSQSDEINFHIQSYFLIVRGKAIKLMKDYFKENGIVKEATIYEIPKLKYDIYGPNNWDIRQKIIYLYEIEMSQHMLSNNIKMGSFMGSPIVISDIRTSINNGLPIIKKKFIKRDFNKHEIDHLRITLGIDIDKELGGIIGFLKTKLYSNMSNLNINYLLEDI